MFQKTKIRGAFFIFFIMVFSYTKAQLLDSLKQDLKMKPVFHYKLDSRSAFIGNKSANVWGIKLGIGFNKNLRFGLGYNYLKSRLPSTETLRSPNNLFPVKARLRIRYLSIYAEYVYYRKNKWELSVPVQFGLGNTLYVPYFSSDVAIIKEPTFLLLYEPCLSVNYRIVKFIGIGTEMGLRLALHKDRQIKEQITAPIYVFKAMIYWGDMINYFWPNHKIPKPIMDVL